MKNKGWVAEYQSTEYKIIVASTKKLLMVILNKHLCKPNCKYCLSEWLIMPKDKFLKAKTFEEKLKAAGYKKLLKR